MSLSLFLKQTSVFMIRIQILLQKNKKKAISSSIITAKITVMRTETYTGRASSYVDNFAEMPLDGSTAQWSVLVSSTRLGDKA